MISLESTRVSVPVRSILISVVTPKIDDHARLVPFVNVKVPRRNGVLAATLENMAPSKVKELDRGALPLSPQPGHEEGSGGPPNSGHVPHAIKFVPSPVSLVREGIVLAAQSAVDGDELTAQYGIFEQPRDRTGESESAATGMANSIRVKATNFFMIELPLRMGECSPIPNTAPRSTPLSIPRGSASDETLNQQWSKH